MPDLEPLQRLAMLGEGVDDVVDVDLDGHAVGGAEHEDARPRKAGQHVVPQAVRDVHHARESKACQEKLTCYKAGALVKRSACQGIGLGREFDSWLRRQNLLGRWRHR